MGSQLARFKPHVFSIGSFEPPGNRGTNEKEDIKLNKWKRKRCQSNNAMGGEGVVSTEKGTQEDHQEGDSVKRSESREGGKTIRTYLTIISEGEDLFIPTGSCGMGGSFKMADGGHKKGPR